MFKRLRQLRISLAAKCQLLFGVAVVLIVAAALSVPWQRIEQLMEQLNIQSAEMLADLVESQHRSAATQPTDVSPSKGQSKFPGQILWVSADRKDFDALTPFERRAYEQFQHRHERGAFYREYERRDGTRGFRYARPIYTATSSPAAPATQPTLLGLVSIDIPSQIEPSQLLLNRVIILSAGLLAGTLAIIVFYLITTRLILQPVRVLQETAEKVSKGDLNIRSDINTGDEFQQLSETFNVMLANLKQGADQLRAMNKSLDLKLGQLAETNLALYESNRLKSEFLANVSHELRTPLNSILGFADLLKESIGADGGDPKGARYLQNILSSSRALLDLINDLLDLAKIEAGKMEIRSEPLALADLFEGLRNILKPLCEAKRLTLSDSIAPDVPILHTDLPKLRQILYNFLSNAIKFSPEGERIDLAAQREGENAVRIGVTDRGPGIDPDKQQLIFEKFRQIDGSATRQHSGTGLGLAISKELATLLEGSIGVRSTPGQGATFWVVLPLKIQAGPQDVRQRLVLT